MPSVTARDNPVANIQVSHKEFVILTHRPISSTSHRYFSFSLVSFTILSNHQFFRINFLLRTSHIVSLLFFSFPYIFQGGDGCSFGTSALSAGGGGGYYGGGGGYVAYAHKMICPPSYIKIILQAT